MDELFLIWNCRNADLFGVYFCDLLNGQHGSCGNEPLLDTGDDYVCLVCWCVVGGGGVT